MSDPAPETIIREALLPKNEHHHRCSSQVGHECDCFYGSRRDGRLAHDALDALVRERDEAREALKREREWSQRVSERNTDLASRLDEALAALDA